MRIHKYSPFAMLLLVIFSTPIVAFGQLLSRKIDSLVHASTAAKTDTDKVKILLELSKKTDCTDSSAKKNYATEAVTLSEKINWSTGVINSNTILGEFYWRCKKNDTACIRCFNYSLVVAEHSHDTLKQAELLSRIGYMYQNSAQYGLSLDYFRRILTLKTDPVFEIGAISNIGNIYYNVGDYPAALANYERSLKELENVIRGQKNRSLVDTMQIAGLLMRIGDVYRAMSQHDKALSNYKNALKLGELSDEQFIKIHALAGIGNTYNAQNNLEKAIEYYNKALEDGVNFDNKRMETQILDQLANVYLAKGELNVSMGYAQKALKLSVDNGIDNWLPINYNTLGKTYTSLRNYGKAVDYFKKSIELSGNTGQLEVKQDALKALSQAYEETHQPALALDAYRQYIAVRDSVYNIGKANELTRIDLQYGYERKQVADSIKQAGEYGLQMQTQKAYTYTSYAGLLMVLLVTFFIYRNYNHQKKANIAIRHATEKMQDEKVISEQLLLNILPEEVARELKTNGNVAAKFFNNVTVLFTDFINFTGAAERFTPQELVAELHACFMAFDRIMSKYRIEKIKTIGDAYMAVSGLPEPDPDHAEKMIRAAFEIRDYMLERKRQLGDRTFGIRIGINSGSAVAGIVGVNKFAYDIWGDTVNIAARMEQNGEEGKINISSTTYDLTKNLFVFSDRGEIDTKHKGKLHMYFVELRDQSPAAV